MAKTPIWQRAEGKNPKGGLNEKGRASLRAEGHDIKRPQPEGGPRKDSFCRRMKGMKAKLTSAETANDPDSRINKSLRAWNCADGGAVDPYAGVQQAAKGGPIWDKPRPKKLGKSEPLSSKEKASAKAAAKAAGRPYPNLIDNMRAARADGGPAGDDAYDVYDDVQRAAHGATPAVPPVTVTEQAMPSTPALDAYRGAINEAVPMPARALASGMMGVHSPITEKDVTPEDRAEIIRQTEAQQKRNAVQEANLRREFAEMTPDEYRRQIAMEVRDPIPFQMYQMQTSDALRHMDETRGKTSVGYDESLYSKNADDFGGRDLNVYHPGQNSVMQAAQRAYSEPAYRVGMTLGRYNVYDTPQGRIVADNYDFNRAPAHAYSKVGLSDYYNGFMPALRSQLNTSFPNINRPVAINLDAKPNTSYTYTGKPFTTPGSNLNRLETKTPDQDSLIRMPGQGGVGQTPRTPDNTMPGNTPQFSTDSVIASDRVPLPPRRPVGFADGGQVEGDVQFADDDPYAKVQDAAKLPMMAQNDFAMRMPQPEVRYDTGPQPGEATMQAYDPTIKERIYQGIAGTEERPSPERAQFARGISQMAEFAPVLGNVMAGQEAQRRGDTKGMLMAALPVPGAATEARMAEAAISPAQEAAREAYQRVLNAQGLYSHAAEAAANLPQAKGSYEQMMAMLQKAGVKPEEMRWSGVEQFAGQPVTREQLASHFEQNVPKIEETVLGYPDETKLNEADAAVREAIRAYNERQVATRYYAHNPERGYASSFFPTRQEAEAHAATLPEAYRPGINIVEQPGKPADVYDIMRRLHAGEFPTNLPFGVEKPALALLDERKALEEAAAENAPKFGQYTLPGGQNYREVLLHMPERIDVAGSRKVGDFVRSMQEKHGERWLSKITPAEEKQYDDLIRLQGEAEKGLEYRSSHWDQPNVLGHLRMSDRTGPEGEKILHLEELQSDWGQQGRDKGFRGEPIQYGSKIEGYIPQGYSWQKTIKPNVSHVIHQLVDRSGNIVGEASTKIDALRKSGLNPTIPSAPYVESTKNWTDLGLKRALKEAAEGGYSKMVWTPGEQQAARYELSKQIRSMDWGPYGDEGLKRVSLYPHYGNPIEFNINSAGMAGAHRPGQVLGTEFEGKHISDIVGKDMAEKILNDTHGDLYGTDLNVGGEGMKGFYDKIVPSRLKELLKKIDPQAKMSFTEIQTKDGPLKVPALEITPKIREAVKKGLPAYAHGGEVVNNSDPYDNVRKAAKISPRARRASH